MENKIEYTKFLNWVPHWFAVYFVGKFSDYILVIVAILIIFYAFYFKQIPQLKNKNLSIKFEYLIFYLILLLILLLWFFNFPSLRYAGYLIVTLVIIFHFLYTLAIK